MGDPRPQRYCNRCLTSFEGDPEKCPNLGCGRTRPGSGWGVLFNNGDVIDRNYRILDKLALGGAGVTYLAQELGSDGTVHGPQLAIKVLFANRDHGPYLRRLATEAQILQELDHPNIVQYMGFVHRSGHSPYLMTRFEQGGSLLDHIKRVGRLPVRNTAQIGRQICWALAMAHKRGVIHRDLKPENVLLAEKVPRDQDPVVRVADFGIAKVDGSLASGLTRIGAFVGTPQYAAPEQFAGGKPSELTDVYGVGAILYFCLTARSVVAFQERQSPEESHQQLVDALPPRVDKPEDVAVDVARINQVFAVAMHPSPDRRCRLDALDAMLAAVVAGKDPELPSVELPLGPITSMGEGEEISAPVVVSQHGAAGERPAQAAGDGLAVSPAPGSGAPRMPVLSPAEAAAVGAARSNPTLATADPTDEVPFPSKAPTTTPAGASASSNSPSASSAPTSTVAALPPTASSLAESDETLPTSASASTKKSGGAGRMLGLVALVLIVGVVVVGGVGVAGFEWWSDRTDTSPGSTTTSNAGHPVDPPVVKTPEPVEVHAGDADPASAAAYEGIREVLTDAWPATVAACGVSTGTSFDVSLTVDTQGALRDVHVVGGAEAVRTCVEGALPKLHASAQRAGGVIVRTTLTW